ncbi:MAG TPA: hypothetical protein VGH33_02220 [Isosphaeraceae bacterium]|jgi:hypothetical protein
MVVPFPDHAIRTLTAVIASHRRLLRMTADDSRRWSRVEPRFDLARYTPKAMSLPIGPRLALRTVPVGVGAMSAR